jgi:hypothetical protein
MPGRDLGQAGVVGRCDRSYGAERDNASGHTSVKRPPRRAWRNGVILHGRDRGDGAPRRVGNIDVTETEVADQALLAQCGQGLEAFGERFAVRASLCRCRYQVKAVKPRTRGSPRPGRAGWQRQPAKDRWTEDRSHLGGVTKPAG